MTSLLRPRAERNPDDSYDTPPALALSICAALRPLLPIPTDVLEPGCGSGSFLRAIATTWPAASSIGVDIRPRVAGAVPRCSVVTADFLAQRVGPTPGLVVGNPPFLLAEQFARRALSLVAHRGHVAFLLRLSFLSGEKRLPFWREHPLRFLVPIAGRPSFTGDGCTDASEYAVLCWQRGHDGRGEILPPLEWR